MTAIQPDDYFASVEARFESPSPYGRKETTVEAPKHVCECGKTFDTEQGLRVHKGRAHSKPDTAPEQKVNPGEEPIPDYEPPTCEACDAPAERKPNAVHVPVVADVRVRVNEPDYRMELIETLCDLASYQLATFADSDTVAEVGPTLARIKAVAR